MILDLIRNDRRALFGSVVLAFIILMTAVSLLSKTDPRSVHSAYKNLPPSLEFPLGTTSLGQDVFLQSAFALRNSFSLGLMMGIFNIIMGALAGLFSGYMGKKVDRVLSAVMDTFIIVPSLPVIMFVSMLFKKNLNTVSLAFLLALFSWPWVARQTRSVILSLREREFTQTAVSSGNNTVKVVFSEHLPFVVPFLIAHFINSIHSSIGSEIVLSIFGLTKLDNPTIGTMIYWAQEYKAILQGFWWWILTPIVEAVLIFVGLYMLATSVSDFLDPRTRLLRIKVRKS